MKQAWIERYGHRLTPYRASVLCIDHGRELSDFCLDTKTSIGSESFSTNDIFEWLGYPMR